ncbi:MAG: hypothetical protein WD646_05810 [Actinomycetota bacterium]
MTRPLRFLCAVGVLALLGVSAGAPAMALRLEVTVDLTTPETCADASRRGLDLACLPEGTVGQLHRQVCSYAWLAGLCESTAFPDPGYATDDDPSPDQPLELRVGAVHEHSSYSDGDPTAIPRDYFRAGRLGHNVADSGGDTGVKLDFMFSSEHSDNGQIPITTNAACLDPASPHFVFACAHLGETHQYWKWPATLLQANEETERSESGAYTGFTGIRGFEWTNDLFNHMNVYFSTNFVNVKIDGSYLSMDAFWNWLREPVAQGGGADALVTFNHPGGDPKLTPFDGGLPHTQLLAQLGGGNWNDVAYVPDVDDRVAGMEINGGEDIEFYVKALTKGWHIGPVTAEDEHEREWSTSAEGKTLFLTRGRSPSDYYFALQNHRSVAIMAPLVGGAPGTKATFPTIHFFADGTEIQDPNATVLGSTIVAPGSHDLTVEADGLPAGSRVALISDTGGGQQSPIQLGAADAGGSFSAIHSAASPASGQDWYFVVVCPAEAGAGCGTNQSYTAVTAPIWLAGPTG